MSDTIERVLFNPANEQFAIGIRLRFADKYTEEPLGNLGGYSIRVEPNDIDAWAINDEAGHWIVVHTSLMKGIEDWGPL